MKTELKSTPATALTKYMQICGLEWKNALSYRGDTWLSAIFSIFSILLAYLLWSAIFAGRAVFGGMTLKQMTTYYLLAGIISSLTQSDDLLWEFSDDIKSGKFIKYLVRPVSPLACFLSAGFARSFLPAISSFVVLACSMAIFKIYFVIPSLIHVLSALPVILLGTLLSSLINYIVSSLAFKLTDISGPYILKYTIINFLSGALIPLGLVFGSGAPAWSPFSYTIYYPVMLCLGLSDISVLKAYLILLLWCTVFLLIALLMQKHASRAFEGVGV